MGEGPGRCKRGMSLEEREIVKSALAERDAHLRWTHRRLERLEGLVVVLGVALLLSFLVRC